MLGVCVADFAGFAQQPGLGVYEGQHQMEKAYMSSEMVMEITWGEVE